MQEPGILIRDMLAEWLVASHIEHAPHKNNKPAPTKPPA